MHHGTVLPSVLGTPLPHTHVPRPTEKKEESGALRQVYKTERAKLRKTRITSVKKVVEREQKLAKLEESHIVGSSTGNWREG